MIKSNTSCPLQYGNTVYLAQALYHLIDPNALFQDDDLCDVSQARKANPVKSVTNKKRITLSDNKNIDDKALQVYPNPSEGNFKITCSSINNSSTIEIVNYIGQVVYKNSNAEFVQGEFSLNINNIVSGIYLIKVTSENNSYNKSIVISKQ